MPFESLKMQNTFQILHDSDAFDTFQNKFPSKSFWIFCF